MRSRLLLTLGLCCLLGPAASAQSNVRPAPRLARVPDLGARMLASAEAERLEDPGEGEARPIPASQRRREEEPGFGFTHLELGLRAHAKADFETGPGSVSMTRSLNSATLGRKLEGETVFALTLEAEASFYRFRDAAALATGAPKPFNDVYDTRLGLLVMEDPRRPASWFAGAEFGLSGEDDAGLRDAFSFGVVGGFRQRVDEDLSVSIGLSGRSRLEDDPWLFPYVGFDWRLTDGLRLFSDGNRVAAIARLSDEVELGLGAEYAIRQFRLNDDSSLPRGVVDDEEITASARLRWEPRPRVAFELEGGVTLWREFATYDSTGTKLTELESDPSGFGGLRLSIGL